VKNSILINTLVALYAELPEVEAIAVAGSSIGSMADTNSDIDLYMFTRDEIALDVRYRIVEDAGGARGANMGLTFWGAGDEWYHSTGIEVDAMFFDADWMTGQIQRVVEEYQASMGYSTAFWRTVHRAQPLFDRAGWFAQLQQRSAVDYPEPLRQNIIALNQPTLRNAIPAYLNQIEKALKRTDFVSINHRLAALLASYFDVIFAFNRVLHPGEKRLLAYAEQECVRLPEGMRGDVEAALRAAALGDAELIKILNTMLDQLDTLLAEDSINVGRWRTESVERRAESTEQRAQSGERSKRHETP
jgi:hypothetical protein